MNLIKRSLTFLFAGLTASAWWAASTVGAGYNFTGAFWFIAAICSVIAVAVIVNHCEENWRTGFIPIAPVVSYLWGGAVASAWWALFTMPWDTNSDSKFFLSPIIVGVAAMVGSVMALIVFAANIGNREDS